MKWTLSRDIAIFFICIAWLILSTVPPRQIAPESIVLFDIPRDKGYFLYDFVNKFSGLLAAAICLIPNRSIWLKVIVLPLFADCLYEVIDLVVTNDKGLPGGVLTQNICIIGALIWGLWQEYRKKPTAPSFPSEKR